MTNKNKDYLNYLKYSVNYDYESGHHECECWDDYCRCGTIESAWVTSIDIDSITNFWIRVYNEVNNVIVKDNDYETIYFINILMAKTGFLDKDLYNVEIVGGYYGEEIWEITHQNMEVLENAMIKLHSFKTLFDKTIFILHYEYGYIADILKNCKSAEIENVELSLINRSQLYWPKIDKNFKILKNVPQWILLQEWNQYKIIDWHHRFEYSKINNIQNSNYIVLN